MSKHIIPPNQGKSFPSRKLVEFLHLKPGTNALTVHQVLGLNQFIGEHWKKGYQFHTYAGSIRILLDKYSIEIKLETDDFAPLLWNKKSEKIHNNNHQIIVECHYDLFPEFVIGHPYEALVMADKVKWDDAAVSASQILADIHEASSYGNSPGAVISYYPPTDTTTMNGGAVTSTMRDLVPDYAAKVKFPCQCRCSRMVESCGVCRAIHRGPGQQEMALPDTIIALNDHCRWTREQIADWLETLDLDLRFDKEAAATKRHEETRQRLNKGKSHMHSVLLAEGTIPKGALVNVVGTTDTQTLTNKTMGEITIDPEVMAELKKQVAEAAKTITVSFQPVFEKLNESMKTFVASPGFKALQAIPKDYPLPDNYSQHNKLIGEA